LRKLEMPISYEVHPGIGIARVGSSDEFFVGPEPDGTPPSKYRDHAGNLLRQAARFRVFKCERDENRRLLSATEVIPAAGTIAWTVHLANRKAVAETFFPTGLKIPTGERPRRNPKEPDRQRLIIDPGPRSLMPPKQLERFDSGRFKDRIVPLGEIRREENGRLLVLGGFGQSSFKREDGRPSPLNSFVDNSDWFDDISDGPVGAIVTAPDGQIHQVTSSWVIIAPPDFAPGITNIVTLYDIALEVAVRRGWLVPPSHPSFVSDVLPILARPLAYAWVSQLASLGHGSRRPGDFSSVWSTLADPQGDPFERSAIVRRLRHPHTLPSSTPLSMPRLNDSTHSTNVLALTPTQFAILQAWAAGNFVGNLDTPSQTSELLPDALDRMSLQACSGGPFYPGIEAGGILAKDEIYSEPFRLDSDSLAPGEVTMGNAVPWQADFWDCKLEGQSGLGWWPAQRPDQVYPDLDAVNALRFRNWDRSVDGRKGMVDNWHRLGVVVEESGPDGKSVFLEKERTFPDL
jgi:hypothetical protein